MGREQVDSNLGDMIDQTVTLKGVAKNAKAGAVIVTENDEVVYIRDLTSWENVVLNKEIIVIGLLSYEKYIPDPVIAEDGAISQGAEGLQFVLEIAEWKFAK